MPSSLFGNSRNPQSYSQQVPQGQIPKQVEDPVQIAKNELAQSGGDVKTAFYNLAKKKGVDPDNFLKQVGTMGDPKKMLESMLMQNSGIGQLLSLIPGLK